MRVDGAEMEALYPMPCHELQIAAGRLYCVTDGFDMQTGILCVPLDNQEDRFFLPVARPYALRWHDGWLYYTHYTERGMRLGRVRGDGTADEILIEAEALGYEAVNLLGFEGDTLFFSTFGLYADGFVGSYSGDEGIRRYGIRQSFAYDDGYFYCSNESDPALSGNGIYRCRADGGGGTLVSGKDLKGYMEICGDWVFARIGRGLNAEPMMIPKDGSALYRTVPGFGKYDYEANRPVDDSPKIEWNRASFGTGNVELILRAYERPAAFRLMAAVNGEPGGEVLFARAEPYTGVKFYFDAGAYILKTAEGPAWIGDSEAFGAGGRYLTTESFDFLAGRAYEIATSGTQGSFHRDDAAGFTQ